MATIDLLLIELKPVQALRLWQQVTFGIVKSAEPDLSTRQLAILLYIYLEPPPHTVRGLAAQLGVTKPVITRALDTMGHLQLVGRRRDPRDRRNVIIQRTVDGALFLERLGDNIVASGRELTR